MGKTLGYMVTFTTYGTWLQGYKKGFVKDGKILKACERLEQANKKALSGDEVKLGKREREIARTAILQEAKRIGEMVLALSVWSNHIHIVIKEGGKPVDMVVNRFKTAAYYALRGDGVDRRVWTTGYDKRFCFNEESLRKRIEYVEGHGT
jgi:REP element-mobilizing transposase RayT